MRSQNQSAHSTGASVYFSLELKCWSNASKSLISDHIVSMTCIAMCWLEYRLVLQFLSTFRAQNVGVAYLICSQGQEVCRKPICINHSCDIGKLISMVLWGAYKTCTMPRVDDALASIGMLMQRKYVLAGMWCWTSNGHALSSVSPLSFSLRHSLSRTPALQWFTRSFACNSANVS